MSDRDAAINPARREQFYERYPREILDILLATQLASIGLRFTVIQIGASLWWNVLVWTVIFLACNAVAIGLRRPKTTFRPEAYQTFLDVFDTYINDLPMHPTQGEQEAIHQALDRLYATLHVPAPRRTTVKRAPRPTPSGTIRINTRTVGDVTVIDIAGRVTVGKGSSALRDALRDLTAQGRKKLILNLAEVSYIDSSGIGELVAGFTTVTNAGGQLKLLNLDKSVKSLGQITKLYTVFENEQAALSSFQQA